MFDAPLTYEDQLEWQLANEKAAIQRVRDLHQSKQWSPLPGAQPEVTICLHCTKRGPENSYYEHPCPTLIALDGAVD